jgi:hypothetical protein
MSPLPVTSFSPFRSLVNIYFRHQKLLINFPKACILLSNVLFPTLHLFYYSYLIQGNNFLLFKLLLGLTIILPVESTHKYTVITTVACIICRHIINCIYRKADLKMLNPNYMIYLFKKMLYTVDYLETLY